MQTIEFLETARWIISQYSEDTIKLILQGNIASEVSEYEPETEEGSGRTERTRRSSAARVLSATHEMVVVADKLSAHPYATEVLIAFNLQPLLDKETIVRIAERMVTFASERDGRELSEFVHMFLQPLPRAWRLLSECLEPIQNLTIPKEVANEKDFDETLTLELRYDNRINPQVETISKVLTDTTKLYEAVAVASGYGEFDVLQVIYITSGSSFRFDFKGLGEPLKQVKELLVEAWKKIRHRKADDFHHNSKAILEGLNLLSEIRSHNRRNELDAETTLRLNQQIVTSMLGLFEEGALPREVKDLEVVSNQELIQGIQRKLLPPAPVEKQERSTTKKDKSAKKRERTNRGKTNRSAKSNTKPS